MTTLEKIEIDCILDEAKTYIAVDGVLAGFSLSAAVTVIQMERRSAFVDTLLGCSIGSAWLFVLALLVHLYTYEAALGGSAYFSHVPAANQGALVTSLRRFSGYGEAVLILGVLVFAVLLLAAGFVHSMLLGLALGPLGVIALIASFVAFRRTGLGGSASYYRSLRR